MRIIKTNIDLLELLAKQALELEPKYTIFEGVLALYKKMIEDHRVYGRYPDPILLEADIYLCEAQETLLLSVGNVKCSKEVCLFVREFQGRLCSRRPLTIQDANKLLIKLLKYEVRYLVINNVYGMNFLESTPACHDALGVQIRVKLRKIEGALIRNRDFYGKFWWQTNKKVPLA
jgi:hypothetical protein